jgi:hypothetical protein
MSRNIHPAPARSVAQEEPATTDSVPISTEHQFKGAGLNPGDTLGNPAREKAPGIVQPLKQARDGEAERAVEEAREDAAHEREDEGGHQ